MAPIKFEEDIKRKLEQRHIQPSEGSWEKLSAKLEGQHLKKNRSAFWWIGIAASLLGLLLVATFIYKDSEINPSHLKMVVTEDSALQQQINTETKNGHFTKTLQETEKLTSTETPSEVVQEEAHMLEQPEAAQNQQLKNKMGSQSSKSVAVSKTVAEENIKSDISATPMCNDDNTMVGVAQTKTPQLNQEASATSELETLLKKAEKDILKQRSAQGVSKIVDANTLLQNVESDLDHSFRVKVFDALKSSYETVKTAVAERND